MDSLKNWIAQSRLVSGVYVTLLCFLIAGYASLTILWADGTVKTRLSDQNQMDSLHPLIWLAGDHVSMILLVMTFFVTMAQSSVKLRPIQTSILYPCLGVAFGGGILFPFVYLPSEWTDESAYRLWNGLIAAAPFMGLLALAIGAYALGYFLVFKPLLDQEARLHTKKGRDD
jgi:hypothetical protein